jgi:hypothetical protein
VRGACKNVGGWWLLADWRSVAVQRFAKRCALRARMGRVGLSLRADKNGAIERMGRWQKSWWLVVGGC